jgi:dihydrofolate reductase
VRDLVVQAFVTLDMVMQAPGGPEEDPTGGFEYGGWSVNAWDETMMEAMGEAESEPSDYLLGRKTYEIFAAHWPHVDDPMGQKLTTSTKYVASNTLEDAEWANTVILSGDAPGNVRELKQADGPALRVLGSQDLIQSLAAADLVDEYGLWIFPVVVGKGKRIFGDDVAPAGFELVDSKISTTGVLMTRYRKKGPVEIASFALEEPTDDEVKRREELEG